MAQLVARYLGVVEAASSSLVTQTKISGQHFGVCPLIFLPSLPRPIWYIRRQRLCCLFLFLLKIFSPFYEVDEVSAIDPF